MIPHEFNGRIYYICEKCGTNTGLRAVVNCSVCAGRRAEAERKRALLSDKCPYNAIDSCEAVHAGNIHEVLAEVKHTPSPVRAHVG